MLTVRGVQRFDSRAGQIRHNQSIKFIRLRRHSSTLLIQINEKQAFRIVGWQRCSSKLDSERPFHGHRSQAAHVA